MTNKSNEKLKNLFDAKLKLQDFIIPPSHVLIVSYDVKSSFTSIPHNVALDCVKTFLENNVEISENTRLNMHELYHLAKMCLESNYFSYRGNIYKQITGTPMGSPVSVVIAEIVMEEIERKILCLPNNFMFWYHYVDDITLCFGTIMLTT